MIRTELNKSHIALINSAVQIAFGSDSWVHEGTLSQGNSPSALYILKVNNKNYVAKLTDPNYPGCNLGAIYGAQIHGFNNMVAPKVHFSDPNTGIVIMDNIESVPFDEINHNQPDMIEKLSKLLKRLHLCSDFDKVSSSYKRIEFRHNMLPLNFKSHPLIKKAMHLKELIQHTLIDDGDIKPSHGDVSPFNLLFDGNFFWLVDWDTATQDNFYFDLVTCLIFFYFNNEEASEIFLNNYFEGTPNQVQRDKINLMKIFVYLYYGITFAFTSSMRKINLLPQGAIEGLPSYLEFMNSIGSGEIDLGEGLSQQQLGFIYLKMADSACSNEEFYKSVKRLKNGTQ
jgi:hypothetical protein